MRDPVVAADGHTYERANIHTWFLEGHTTSPVSGEMMRSIVLYPNHHVRSTILEAERERDHELSSRARLEAEWAALSWQGDLDCRACRRLAARSWPLATLAGLPARRSMGCWSAGGRVTSAFAVRRFAEAQEALNRPQRPPTHRAACRSTRHCAQPRASRCGAHARRVAALASRRLSLPSEVCSRSSCSWSPMPLL